MQDNVLRLVRTDLSGRWWVKHRVRSSRLPRFVGLEIEFYINLAQDGEALTGDGEKFAVGWRLAGRNEASRLELNGRVHGADVQIALVEHPPAKPDRTIFGSINWKVVNPGRLVGEFRVDAADTSGSSEAVRA
jgi:hypothetical protein